MRITILAAAATAFSLASQAGATNTVSYAFSANTMLPAFVQQFDPSLGTLEGYQISYTTLFGETFLTPPFMPDGPQPYSGTYTGSVGYMLDGPVHASDIVSLSGSYQCAASPTCSILLSASHSTSGGASAGLIGKGTIVLQSLGSVSLSGHEMVLPHPISSTTGTLTYLFSSPVPEPASWLTMICGFGVVSTVLRVRRRGKASNRQLAAAASTGAADA